MSALGNESQVTKLLGQELQNELNTAHQLLKQISEEQQKLKELTRPGGELEAKILQNASLTKKLAKHQQVDLENLPPFFRREIDMQANEKASNEEDNALRNDSELEENR